MSKPFKVTCKLCDSDLTGPARLFGIPAIKSMHWNHHQKEVLDETRNLLVKLAAETYIHHLHVKSNELLIKIDKLSGEIIQIEGDTR